MYMYSLYNINIFAHSTDCNIALCQIILQCSLLVINTLVMVLHYQEYIMFSCYYLMSCRYELPQPSAAQKNDVGAWQDSVSNSRAQLEHQNERLIV